MSGRSTWRGVRDADIVGISVNTTLTHQTAYQFAREVHRIRPDVPIVAGGHHATLNVREALTHADFVVRGYAETAFPELVEAIGRGERKPTTHSVSYLDPKDGQMVENPSTGSTPMEALPDLDSIVGYSEAVDEARWKLPVNGIFLPLSYASRGCAFHCNFCSIPLADDRVMGYRTVADLVEDLERQTVFYRVPWPRTRFWLIDDNFGQNPARSKSFLRELIERLPPRCEFVVQARVEIAKDPQLLELMHRARFRAIYLGVESVSNESLESMNKRSDREAIRTAIAAIHAAGIRVIALLMFGNDGDRPAQLASPWNTSDSSG